MKSREDTPELVLQRGDIVFVDRTYELNAGLKDTDLIEEKGFEVDLEVDMSAIRENLYSESNKYKRGRPWLIIQPSKACILDSILMAPISSVFREPKPFRQEVMLGVRSFIHYNLIEPISRKSIKNKIGSLNKKQMLQMDLCITVCSGTNRNSIGDCLGIFYMGKSRSFRKSYKTHLIKQSTLYYDYILEVSEIFLRSGGHVPDKTLINAPVLFNLKREKEYSLNLRIPTLETLSGLSQVIKIPEVYVITKEETNTYE